MLKDGAAVAGGPPHEILSCSSWPPVNSHLDMPTVRKAHLCILVVGVNGVGKTTTIGKMARQLQQQGSQ